MRNPGRKISAFQEYTTRTERDGFRAFSPREQREMNQEAMRPRENQDFDGSDHRFFLREEITQVLSEGECAALDAMLESHGIRNCLSALVQLIESRVDEAQLVNGRLLHHLARENDYAYAAERLLGLLLDPRIAKL